MIAQKIIITTEAVDLDIKGITLLSIREYESCKDKIKPTSCSWWLRSPGRYADTVVAINGAGGVLRTGYNVSRTEGLRPALKIDLESSNLRIRDKIEWANYRWTIISDSLMLCDEIIAEHPFREDWEADDANDYEKSDIKQWLENWLAKQMESDNE